MGRRGSRVRGAPEVQAEQAVRQYRQKVGSTGGEGQGKQYMRYVCGGLNPCRNQPSQHI
jgi:hypothetical protein